jgi:hypothetical protein
MPFRLKETPTNCNKVAQIPNPKVNSKGCRGDVGWLGSLRLLLAVVLSEPGGQRRRTNDRAGKLGVHAWDGSLATGFTESRRQNWGHGYRCFGSSAVHCTINQSWAMMAVTNNQSPLPKHKQ